QVVFGQPSLGQRGGGGGGGWDRGQGGGRGGDGGGGGGGDFRGRRGDNRPMSGDDVANRVKRISDLLNEMDTNHNGVIEQDEANNAGGRKDFLERMISRTGKEPHYPVAISEVVQGLETYYRSQAQSGGGQSPTGGAQQPTSRPASGL